MRWATGSPGFVLLPADIRYMKCLTRGMRTRSGLLAMCSYDRRFFTECGRTHALSPVCSGAPARSRTYGFYPSGKRARRAASFRPCLRCRPNRTLRHAHARCALDGRVAFTPGPPDLSSARAILCRLFRSISAQAPIQVARTTRCSARKRLCSDETIFQLPIANARGLAASHVQHVLCRVPYEPHPQNSPPTQTVRYTAQAHSTACAPTCLHESRIVFGWNHFASLQLGGKRGIRLSS